MNDTMFDISLSTFAWISVVAFQAVVHYGILGPGNSKHDNNNRYYYDTIQTVGDDHFINTPTIH